jgi:3D (Asp-Asp-Asp) domain-containing protein
MLRKCFTNVFGENAKAKLVNLKSAFKNPKTMVVKFKFKFKEILIRIKNYKIQPKDLRCSVKTTAATFAFMAALIANVANASEKTTKSVTLIINGTNNYYQTNEKTVGDFLLSAGVEFDESAKINEDESAEIYDNMEIDVVQNEVKDVEYKEILQYKTEIEYSDELEVGTSQVKTNGAEGEKKITVSTVYTDGEAGESSKKEEIVKEPVNQVVVVGTKKKVVPDTKYGYTDIITMSATAYAPVVECCGKDDGITANGSYAGRGVVAVDPTVIPLGTKLYVQGYGFCVAADTGGAIKGNKIDLCYNTYQEALNYGRKDVKVYILS